MPPIIVVTADGTRSLVHQIDFNCRGRVVYRPKELNPDGSPVDPTAAEVWVELMTSGSADT